MSKFIAIIFMFIPMVSLAGEPEPSGEELYDLFRKARAEISKTGPSGTVKYYSREWLEYVIKSAFDSAEKDHSDINYTKDALWAGFQGLGLVNSVYSYSITKYGDMPAIYIQVTSGKCNTPSSLTYVFLYEGGAWRISRKVSDSTDKEWFNEHLDPIDKFSPFEGLNRSKVWEEVLGYVPEEKKCH